MFQKISKLLLLSMMSLVIAATSTSCTDPKEDEPENPTEQTSTFKTTLPSRMEIEVAEEMLITLDYTGTFKAEDKISFGKTGEVAKDCITKSIADGKLTVALPPDVLAGEYIFYHKHDGTRATLGNMTLVFFERHPEVSPGTTIFGIVKADGKPLEGVLVSDGYEFAKTSADGLYELKSEKKNGYVFMITPSGYVPEQEGVFPKMYALTQLDAASPEQFDFKLKKVDQSKFKVLFFGDMHLGNRNSSNSDMKQFGEFANDVNAWLGANKDMPVYAITLGDMTWDLYWKNQMEPKHYVPYVNGLIDNNLLIWHTIGNHDNDMAAVKSNFNAKKPYRAAIAPNYYSYNIGSCHFIALDDIDCCDYDGASRNYYSRLVDEQLAWIEKDLSYVDMNTTVFVMMHAPLYGMNRSSYAITNGAALANKLKGRKVHIVTGHTHKVYNVTKYFNIVGGEDYFEHNAGAVCGSWWWSGHLTGVHLSQDGTPGGYSIFNFDGNKIDWIFKGTGKSTDYQFRTYDLNEIKFTDDDVPNINKSCKAYDDWCTLRNAYKGTKNDYVLINIWNYNPSWKVTVQSLEDGRTLPWTLVGAYDAYHIAALSIPRFNGCTTASSTTPSFTTSYYTHFFRVQCKNATEDLQVVVEDEFGHKWIEKMERPKKWDFKAYQQQY